MIWARNLYSKLRQIEKLLSIYQNSVQKDKYNSRAGGVLYFPFLFAVCHTNGLLVFLLLFFWSSFVIRKPSHIMKFLVTCLILEFFVRLLRQKKYIALHHTIAILAKISREISVSLQHYLHIIG